MSEKPLSEDESVKLIDKSISMEDARHIIRKSFRP
jgi:hypothetical protein